MQLSSEPANISAAAAQITVIHVSGMHCAKCVKAVETQLLQQPGVIAATVNLATATAVVECKTDVNSIELAACLTAAGFPSQLQTAQPISDTESQISVHWTLTGFFILAVVFNLCLNAQVITVGLAYLLPVTQ